jgi:hypothetical protein
MERRVFSVPAALRERYVLTDGFNTRLKQRGWTLFEHRPIYTDPQVIRQRWLRAPSGRTYSDHDFYSLFGAWEFRAVLRTLLACACVSTDQIMAACPQTTKRDSYLTFLHDQEMLLHTRGGYERGPALASLQDIGHTLEWWCAEWLRRAYAFPFGQVPAHHGVTLTEWLRDGDPGDLDVVAFPGETLLLMECKSSLLAVDPTTLNLFSWRAAQFGPDLAILLIDAPAAQTRPYLASVKRRIKRWEIKPVDDDETRGVYWNDGQPIAATHSAPGTIMQSVNWERANIYVALSSEHNSLEDVLSRVIQHASLHALRAKLDAIASTQCPPTWLV